MFDSDGDPVGNDFIVQGPTLGRFGPDVAASPTGGYAVTSRAFTTNVDSVGVRIVDAQGTTTGSFVIFTDKASQNPSIAAFSNGQYVVTWSTSPTPNTNQLFARLFDANGTPIGSDILVAATSTNSPEVVVLADDKFIVAWNQFARIYNSDGTPAGDPFVLNNGNSGGPELAPFDDGGFVATWFSTDNGDGSGTSIRAGLFSTGMPNPLFGTEGADTLSGTDGADNIFGYGSGDTINGNGGNDRLDGGAGGDVMRGGTGNDAYIVNSALDQVIENAGEGAADRVESAIDYALGANVEVLILTGAAVSGTGNELVNEVYGNALDNIINGGAGADSLYGGAGSDSYVIDNAVDHIIENAGEGTADAAVSSTDYALGANVEVLILTGTAVSGTGNELVNEVYGNALDNIINGGAGADSLYGGAGSDSYVVDNIFDHVIENAGEGTADAVVTSTDYALGANVEVLILTGAAVSGTGNELTNQVYGNALDNIVNGGAGGDSLYGGAGSDSYIVDNALDRVIENAGEGGADTVVSAIDLTLEANIEALVLSGPAVSGTGNELDNSIFGNALDNIINGAAGSDALNGGGGRDSVCVPARCGRPRFGGRS